MDGSEDANDVMTVLVPSFTMNVCELLCVCWRIMWLDFVCWMHEKVPYCSVFIQINWFPKSLEFNQFLMSSLYGIKTEIASFIAFTSQFICMRDSQIITHWKEPSRLARINYSTIFFFFFFKFKYTLPIYQSPQTQMKFHTRSFYPACH